MAHSSSGRIPGFQSDKESSILSWAINIAVVIRWCIGLTVNQVWGNPTQVRFLLPQLNFCGVSRINWSKPSPSKSLSFRQKD